MNITRAWTNERFLLPIDLTSWVAAYPLLPDSRIVAQIRTAAASPKVLYAWDSVQMPEGFEGSLTFSVGPPPKLQIYAPSASIARVFHPAGGDFEWEFGFYTLDLSSDYIRIDGGSCHFEPGVIRA